MPEIFTRWRRPPKNPEVNSGESITEEAGSIPFPELVKLSIAQGERNRQWKARNFDAVDERDNLDGYQPIPYKEDELDLADRRKAVAARLRRTKAEYDQALEAQKALEADPEAADEPEDDGEGQMTLPGAETSPEPAVAAPGKKKGKG